MSIVLVSPRNPLNIGAAARAMSNFGFGDLRLVNAYDVAFQEAKSAVNAGWVLQETRNFASLPEALSDCSYVVGATGVTARDPQVPLHRLEQAAPDLHEASRYGRVALVFGSEKHGLSREDISYCHRLLHIPTRPAHDSMNLGQAVAICLYELVRAEPEALQEGDRPVAASTETLDLLHDRLFTVLKHSGYVNRTVAGSVEIKLRQLLRRLAPNAEDATLLLGMVRQISLVLENDALREKCRQEWQDAPPD